MNSIAILKLLLSNYINNCLERFKVSSVLMETFLDSYYAFNILNSCNLKLITYFGIISPYRLLTYVVLNRSEL